MRAGLGGNANRGVSVGTRFRGGPKVLNRLVFQVEESEPKVHPDAPDTLRDDFEAAGVRKSQTRSFIYTVFEEERDDPFKPTRGSYGTLQLQVAGGPMGGDNSFVRGQAAWHGYTDLPIGGVLAGFIGGYLKNSKRITDPEFIKYIRAQQMNKLLGRETIWK